VTYVVLCFVAVSGTFFEVAVWLAWSTLHHANSDCVDGMGAAVWQLSWQRVSISSARRYCRRCTAYDTAVLWSFCATTRTRGHKTTLVAGTSTLQQLKILIF